MHSLYHLGQILQKMDKLEQQLKSIILKTVEFQLDGKTIKRGKIKVINTKHFFIRFKLESDTGVKDYDLPYPFKIDKLSEGLLFDYSLSAFCPRTEDVYWKMFMMNKSEASKLHNAYLNIISL